MRSRDETFLRSRAAPILVAGARARGADVDVVLDRLGLPAHADASRTLELPLRVLRELGDALAIAAGDPFLGLHVGASLAPGSYGLLEYCLRTSATLRDAMHRYATYSAAVDEVSTIEVRESSRHAVLRQRVPGDPLGAGRQVVDLTLALYVVIVRDVLGDPRWCPDAVLFPHRAPRDRGALRALFGDAELVFDDTHAGLRLPRAVLDRPLVSAEPRLLAVLEEQIRKEVGAAVPSTDFESALLRAIRDRLGTAGGSVTLAAIARTLGTSPRSLQRRLQSKRLSFQGVVEQARRALAEDYLSDSQRTLDDVASAVGYTQLRAFTRAFRRWTGTTPSAWRRLHTSRPVR